MRVLIIFKRRAVKDVGRDGWGSENAQRKYALSTHHLHTINETKQDEVLNTARALGVIPGFSLLMVDTENKFVSTGALKKHKEI